VDNSLRGYNCSVFAYGQTGSGKTYTMMGSGSADVQDTECGLIPRICDRLFKQMAQRALMPPLPAGTEMEGGDVGEVGAKAFSKTKVTATFLEIYNEQVRDLLLLFVPKGRLILHTLHTR
jgi:hypothetical protein